MPTQVELIVMTLLALSLMPAFAQPYGSAESSKPAKPVVDAAATVHVPAMSIPFSSLGSPEAKRNYLQFIRGFEALAAGRCGSLDDCLFKPGVARLRAAFAVEMTPQIIAGVQTDVIVPAGGVSRENARRVLLNLHGGGFIVGARYGGQMESIPISSIGRFKVITVDYREGPQHRFPAASEDVAKVYRELLKEYRPENIGIYGCSAGGMLAAQSAAWLQTQKLPRPGALGIFGSGAIVTRVGDSAFVTSMLSGFPPPPETNDPRHGMPYFDVSNIDLRGPLISPAFHPAVLAGFPPSLLVSGSRDPLLSGATYTHAQLIKAGVDADLHVWDGAAHCSFAQPIVDPDVPENREAWDVIVKFFERHLGTGRASS